LRNRINRNLIKITNGVRVQIIKVIYLVLLFTEYLLSINITN